MVFFEDVFVGYFSADRKTIKRGITFSLIVGPFDWVIASPKTCLRLGGCQLNPWPTHQMTIFLLGADPVPKPNYEIEKPAVNEYIVF